MGKLHRIDTKVETEGVWFNYGGIRLKIARWGNPAFAEALRQSLEPHEVAIESKQLSDSVAREALAEVMSQHILVGWEDLTDEDDKPIPYSKAKAKELLLDPAYAQFNQDVTRFAKNAAAFRERKVADAAKT